MPTYIPEINQVTLDDKYKTCEDQDNGDKEINENYVGALQQDMGT